MYDLCHGEYLKLLIKCLCIKGQYSISVHTLYARVLRILDYLPS